MDELNEIDIVFTLEKELMLASAEGLRSQLTTSERNLFVRIIARVNQNRMKEKICEDIKFGTDMIERGSI